MNNAAERAIRPAVIWRRTSFGSQTQAGSRFVQRMLGVVTTLKSQRRNVLDFMTSAVSAARSHSSAPFLFPEVADSSDEVINRLFPHSSDPVIYLYLICWSF